MLFKRIAIERPEACTHGWIACAHGWIGDREGVYSESRCGGQACTVSRLFSEGHPALADVERIGWISHLKSRQRGAGGLALQSIIYRFIAEDVDAIGLIALPDDEAFLPRLINYYRRHGFEIIADYDAYPVMLLRPTA